MFSCQLSLLVIKLFSCQLSLLVIKLATIVVPVY